MIRPGRILLKERRCLSLRDVVSLPGIVVELCIDRACSLL